MPTGREVGLSLRYGRTRGKSRLSAPQRRANPLDSDNLVTSGSSSRLIRSDSAPTWPRAPRRASSREEPWHFRQGAH